MAAIADQLATAGLWVRQWPFPSAEEGLLRFGLLSSEDQRQRLKQQLEKLSAEFGLQVLP